MIAATLIGPAALFYAALVLSGCSFGLAAEAERRGDRGGVAVFSALAYFGLLAALVAVGLLAPAVVALLTVV